MRASELIPPPIYEYWSSLFLHALFSSIRRLPPPPSLSCSHSLLCWVRVKTLKYFALVPLLCRPKHTRTHCPPTQYRTLRVRPFSLFLLKGVTGSDLALLPPPSFPRASHFPQIHPLLESAHATSCATCSGLTLAFYRRACPSTWI